jgi:hypothetical protein
MVNTNAFSTGAQEGNWWANYVAAAPEREAKQAAMEAEQQRMVEQYKEQQRREAILSQSGPAIVEIVKGFDAYERPTPAKTSEVERQFQEVFPGAAPGEFRNALEELKGMGVIHEVTSSIGFMGARDTNLHYMGGWEEQMKELESLSFPAQAVYSELKRTGELMRRDEFLKEFEADYEAIMEELKNAGLYPEPASSSWGNSNGVLFKNRNTRYNLEVR